MNLFWESDRESSTGKYTITNAAASHFMIPLVWNTQLAGARGLSCPQASWLRFGQPRCFSLSASLHIISTLTKLFLPHNLFVPLCWGQFTSSPLSHQLDHGASAGPLLGPVQSGCKSLLFRHYVAVYVCICLHSARNTTFIATKTVAPGCGRLRWHPNTTSDMSNLSCGLLLSVFSQLT